jgi:pimeloyl-ACP methyl ester carboxylesterase
LRCLKIILMGHSEGGMIANMVAAKHTLGGAIKMGTSGRGAVPQRT